MDLVRREASAPDLFEMSYKAVTQAAMNGWTYTKIRTKSLKRGAQTLAVYEIRIKSQSAAANADICTGNRTNHA